MVANIPMSIGTTKIAAYAYKVYVCLFATKNMGMFIALISFICFCIKLIIIDIIYSIEHQVSSTKISQVISNWR